MVPILRPGNWRCASCSATSVGLFALIPPSTYVRSRMTIGSRKVGAAPVARPASQSSQSLL